MKPIVALLKLTFYFRVIGATYQEHKAYEGAAFEEILTYFDCWVIGATYQEHKAYEGAAFEEMDSSSLRRGSSMFL